jgi:hypothetical protein
MRLARLLPALALGFVPAVAAAQRTLTVNLGTDQTLAQVVENVVTFMARSVGIICAALVIVGAFMIVASRGEDSLKNRGKDLIIYSLIGMAVVLGAAAILRMTFFVIYSAA